ncbi:DUF4123 domain-containing protein [Pseudomonas sp. MBLB4123]|uniref:DUF4123 domain-containing protein n=1 Tax=Pseudomonas sp. MBLB4123 TaxID=3451557 RepID=UPI003F755135
MSSKSPGLMSLPTDLPWAEGAALLLDGVSVERLPQRLYEWTESPVFEPLYLTTRWSDLSELSPCLIPVAGPHDPVLAQFFANAGDEWGYLVFGHEREAELLTHLRWLLSVRHPLGDEMLLRLADPAVANALLGHAVQHGDTTLFGPIKRVVAADALNDCWQQHLRAGAAAEVVKNKPYGLSDEQLSLLGEVGFRGIVLQLDQHMQEYFPAYQVQLTRRERLQHVHDLALSAYQQGFNSERDITLYANVFGFLGHDALHAHKDIAALLNTPSAQTPSQRVEQAARIAQDRAAPMERSSV